MSPSPTTDDFLALILLCRSISPEQKQSLLAKFSDPTVSDTDLATELRQLCDREAAFRQQENTALTNILVENDGIQTAEEARLAPVLQQMDQITAREERKIAEDFQKQAGGLERQLDGVLETAQQSLDTQKITALRQKLTGKR